MKVNNQIPDELENVAKTLTAILEETAKKLREIQAEKDVLEKGIRAVATLISESEGVTGLHLNGEIATWESILEGGHYEDWLFHFSTAESLLTNKEDGE